jgi:hypothetical protein
VQGRITEKHLFLAESSFPGIAELYWTLDKKPKTFLQLVWMYESILEAELPTQERVRQAG